MKHNKGTFSTWTLQSNLPRRTIERFVDLNNCDVSTFPVEDLKPVVATVRHDHVAHVIHDQSRWILELARPGAAASKTIRLVSVCVENINAVQPEIHDVDVSLVEVDEPALGLDFVLRLDDVNQFNLLHDGTTLPVNVEDIRLSNISDATLSL